MNAPELALHHQRLAARVAQLRAQIQRQQAELSSDPEAESLQRALEAERRRAAEAAPALGERIDREEAELAAATSELASTWEQLPADWQAAYRRVASRIANPVAEVVGNKCQACRVAVTSNGMQV